MKIRLSKQSSQINHLAAAGLKILLCMPVVFFIFFIGASSPLLIHQSSAAQIDDLFVFELFGI